MKNLQIGITGRIIGSDERFKPTDPCFKIINDGGIDIFINENYRVRSHQQFGLNLDNLVSEMQAHGYELEMNTQYRVSFAPRPAYSGNPIIDAIIIILYYLNRHFTYQQTTAKIK